MQTRRKVSLGNNNLRYICESLDSTPLRGSENRGFSGTLNFYKFKYFNLFSVQITPLRGSENRGFSGTLNFYKFKYFNLFSVQITPLRGSENRGFSGTLNFYKFKYFNLFSVQITPLRGFEPRSQPFHELIFSAEVYCLNKLFHRKVAFYPG